MGCISNKSLKVADSPKKVGKEERTDSERKTSAKPIKPSCTFATLKEDEDDRKDSEKNTMSEFVLG